jgi:hypothetical protein
MRQGSNRPSGALRLLTRAVVLALAFACVWAAGASADVQANAHGVVSAVNGFSLFGAGSSEWGLQMAAMRLEGVQVVRSDAPWAAIQPQQPSSSDPGYQWSTYDSWVGALAANGLTWQPIIDYDGSWTTAVGDNAAYAAFAQAVAARYGPGGSFWSENPSVPYHPVQIFEIWNEENVPDSQYWNYYVSPEDYGPLYTAARTAIHQVDPSASVDVGGLGTDNDADTYLSQLLSDYPQLATSVDGFALHPYSDSAADTEQWVSAFRGVLNSYHVPASVPIDLTEFGWPYQAGDESWRAAQMSAVGNVFSRSNCGIREVAPYDWVNPISFDGSTNDFGLVDISDTSTQLRLAGVDWFTALTAGGAEATYQLCGSQTSTPPATSSSPQPETSATSAAVKDATGASVSFSLSFNHRTAKRARRKSRPHRSSRRSKTHRRRAQRRP